MNNKFIISCCGSAGAGKNTFADIIQNKFKEKGLAAQQMSLAEPLKAGLRDFIFNRYRIDIYDCTREEKDSIRHIIVAASKEKRANTDGRYFVLSKLSNTALPVTKETSLSADGPPINTPTLNFIRIIYFHYQFLFLKELLLYN